MPKTPRHYFAAAFLNDPAPACRADSFVSSAFLDKEGHELEAKNGASLGEMQRRADAGQGRTVVLYLRCITACVGSAVCRLYRRPLHAIPGAGPSEGEAKSTPIAMDPSAFGDAIFGCRVLPFLSRFPNLSGIDLLAIFLPASGVSVIRFHKLFGL